MKASDLLVKCLEEEGIEYIFGVPGEENADLMVSLEKSTKIRFILTRHEQGGAFMAEAYGRLTGNPAGCLGTLGPGATNLVTGVADANMDRSPVLVLTGQGATLVFLDRELADPDRGLTGRLWTIDSLVDAQAVSNVPAGVVPTVTFGDDGTLTLEAGCNTCNGTYQATNAELTFDPMVCTRMACLEPGASETEAHSISRSCSRFCISAAAILVKVRHRIRSGATPSSSSRRIRFTST